MLPLRDEVLHRVCIKAECSYGLLQPSPEAVSSTVLVCRVMVVSSLYSVVVVVTSDCGLWTCWLGACLWSAGTQESKAACQLVQWFFAFIGKTLGALQVEKDWKLAWPFCRWREILKAIFLVCQLFFRILIILFHFYAILPVHFESISTSFSLIICAVVDIQNSLLIK